MGSFLLAEGWTVDYGDGPVAISIPHAWGEEIAVYDEGPIVYQNRFIVPDEALALKFHGVSYAAEVLIDREFVGFHRGIWDAWTIDLVPFRGREIELVLRVTKNGGENYPVAEAASGFLPYVFHGFGGVYQRVEILTTPEPRHELTAPRVSVEEDRIYVDGKPFLMRGILHWGWYPDLRHPNPPEAVIRAELAHLRSLGFNCVKFCLWIPPHRYLELLEEYGLVGWIELPLWNPSPEPSELAQIETELRAVVLQYAHHRSVIAWTVGCELDWSVPPEFRRSMVEFIQHETRCPLVRDNSGGAEMYGGDLREFGTFYDFHPYADVQFFPPILDNLLPGCRPSMPTLLGETNDSDVHRDLARIRKEEPFWASRSAELNAKGVRWQYDLPTVVPTNRFASAPNENRHERLMESSCQKSLWIRRHMTESIRARAGISGYVLTGIRDTPISSSGLFDDWNEPRFEASEFGIWNAPEVLFQIAVRRPSWVNGGNRPGWLDLRNFFCGQVFHRIGMAVESAQEVELRWSVIHSHGETVFSGLCASVKVPELSAVQIGEISWNCDEPGEYTLAVEAGNIRNAWPIWVVPKREFEGFNIYDPYLVLPELKNSADGIARISTRFRPESRPTVQFLFDEATSPAPFWRESAFEFFDREFWERCPFAERWDRLLPICTDRVIDVDELAQYWGRDYQILMNRVDVRTYEEAPVLIRYPHGYVTTLRPFGGLGKQPWQVGRSPAGSEFLHGLITSRMFGHRGN